MSLLEIMQQFHLSEFFERMDTLERWALAPLSSLLDERGSEIVRFTLQDLRSQCVELSLYASFQTLQKMEYVVFQFEQGATKTTLDLRELSKEALGRIRDELSGVSFLAFSLDEAGRWWNRQPFGSEVFERFPSATIDSEEASRCLAVGLATAAVFHLMRVMEVGLKSTANALGIPYAPSWESYLKQIQERIDKKWRQKGIKWKRDEPFFREVLGHLQAVKVAWRNPTMHIVNHYSPSQAEDVFNAVHGFMRHLASRLAEK